MQNKNFKKIIIDLGTGDGRFVYKKALNNPENFYYGLDPAPSQFKDYQRKINRRKLNNIKLIQGSVEDLPTYLKNSADKIYVNLPWGTLLQNLVKGKVESIISLLKNNLGTIEIILGYDENFEPTETDRLELPKLKKELLEKSLIKSMNKKGFDLISFEDISKDDLKKLETSWAKKLSFGNPRKIFKLIFAR